MSHPAEAVRTRLREVKREMAVLRIEEKQLEKALDLLTGVKATRKVARMGNVPKRGRGVVKAQVLTILEGLDGEPLGSADVMKAVRLTDPTVTFPSIWAALAALVKEEKVDRRRNDGKNYLYFIKKRA